MPSTYDGAEDDGSLTYDDAAWGYDGALAAAAFGGPFTNVIRRSRFPRVFATLDDEPIGLADWSSSSSVGVGHDQLRGIVAAKHIRQMPHVTQGALAKLWTEDGFPLFEGRLGQPPKLDQDGTGHIAAQGHGYEAHKYRSRIVVRLHDAGAWIPANLAPLNWRTGNTDHLNRSPGIFAGTGDIGFTVNARSNDPAQAAAALWAPGMRFGRIRVDLQGQNGQRRWVIYSADGPDIARTARPEGNVESVDPFARVIADVTLTRPGDAVVLQWVVTDTSPVPEDTGIVRFYQNLALGGVSGEGPLIGGVWGDIDYENIYSEHAGRIVARRLGWDENYITGRGTVPHLNLDSAGGAAAILDYVCALENWRWCTWEDRGNGPVLDVGPYRKVWEVSARTGARWDLDPLELVNRLVVQFLTSSRSYAEAILEADPDPLEAAGITREAQAQLADTQLDPELAYAVAYANLRELLKQRWRGRIRVARAFEEGTGRDAPYEVRAGDLVRITDSDEGGTALELPIHEVAYDAGGITIGVEAPAIPGADLVAHAAPLAGLAPPLALSTSTGGAVTYVVPGGPGSGVKTPGPQTGGVGSKTPSPRVGKWWG